MRLIMRPMLYKERKEEEDTIININSKIENKNIKTKELTTELLKTKTMITNNNNNNDKIELIKFENSTNIDLKKPSFEKDKEYMDDCSEKSEKSDHNTDVISDDDQNTNKPNHSYISLIANAILASKEKRLVLSDIYSYVLENFSYFRNKGPGWRNSIRHNLSLNECFVKAGRSPNGKGHYWAINPANYEDFSRGDFRRRRAQRRARRAMSFYELPEHYNLRYPQYTLATSIVGLDNGRGSLPLSAPTMRPTPTLRPHSTPLLPSFNKTLSLTNDYNDSLKRRHSVPQEHHTHAHEQTPKRRKRRGFDVESLLRDDIDDETEIKSETDVNKLKDATTQHKYCSHYHGTSDHSIKYERKLLTDTKYTSFVYDRHSDWNSLSRPLMSFDQYKSLYSTAYRVPLH